MLKALADPARWLEYQEYKRSSGHLSRRDDAALEDFIQTKGYLPVVEGILQDQPFSKPQKREISKLHSGKKRVVYTYREPENWVLKLLTFLLQRKYDRLFCPNLYSFRKGRSVRDAVKLLTGHPDIQKMWAYKVDISNYFNSIPIPKLLPMLREALKEEVEVYRFLETILCDPWVEADGVLLREDKGIMAGTPISTFLADLYLNAMDWHFYGEKVLYARYSDDIILFALSREALQTQVSTVQAFLARAGLSVNREKEEWTAPGQMWTYLGISYRDGVVDVAPASVDKLKGKMRRKARALSRWAARKNATGSQAAGAFIRKFNQKLFENTNEHDLTWSVWYFPLINTDVSLREIDQYCQSCIRSLATGKHNKSSYNFRYEQMKELGYLSLVNRYYKVKKESTLL